MVARICCALVNAKLMVSLVSLNSFGLHRVLFKVLHYVLLLPY